jgi:Zn-dependent metalloprotease
MLQRQSFLKRESVNNRQHIVPPHILRNIAESDASDETRSRARESLGHLEGIIGKVRGSLSGPQPESQQVLEVSDHDATKPSSKGPYRAIHDIHESSNEGKLPGDLVRDNKKETDKSKDKSVNLAFDNVGVVLDFYKKH